MIDILKKQHERLVGLCRQYKVTQLEVFGSATDSEQFKKGRSDIDFLVSFSEDAEPKIAELYLDFISALRDLFDNEVDVVMKRSIRNPYFRQVIDRSRTTIYAA